MKPEMQTENSNERNHRIEGAIFKSLTYRYKNFRNKQEIGRGSSGSIVYRANWKNFERYLALKSFFNLDDITVKELVHEVIIINA